MTTKKCFFASSLAGLWLFCTGSSAWACCETALSCVAAVASSGTTCVIDAAVYALQLALQKLDSETKTREEEFETARRGLAMEADREIDNAKKAADAALQSLRTSAAEARKISGDDLKRLHAAVDALVVQQTANYGSAGGTQASPSGSLGTQTKVPTSVLGQSSSSSAAARASTAAVYQKLLADNSMESMRLQIESLLKQSEKIATSDLASSIQQAAATRAAAEARLNQTYADLVRNPTAALMFEIAKHLEPINWLTAPQFILVVWAEMATLIERYSRDFEPAVQTAAQQLNQQIEPVRAAVALLQNNAQNAAVILAKMQEAVRLQTAAERQAILAGLAKVTQAPPARIVVRLNSTSAVLTASKRLLSSFATIQKDLQSFNPKPGRVDLAPIQKKLADTFDRAFKTASADKAKQARNNLTAEARRYYSGDPKLLAAIEKIIADGARARSVN